MRLIPLLLVLFALGGCFYDEILPVPPAPPVPPVPPPEPPVPSELVSRTIFDAINVGDPEEMVHDLVTPERTVTVGPKTIYRWVLDEPRPEGGYLSWEIHAEGGVVVASFAW